MKTSNVTYYVSRIIGLSTTSFLQTTRYLSDKMCIDSNFVLYVFVLLIFI